MIALKTCAGNSRHVVPSHYDADAPMLLVQDAKPLRSEVSDLDARESLLWIRVNWPGALFRKGIRAGNCVGF
jgi:hypothetical protein